MRKKISVFCHNHLNSLSKASIIGCCSFLLAPNERLLRHMVAGWLLRVVQLISSSMLLMIYSETYCHMRWRVELVSKKIMRGTLPQVLTKLLLHSQRP
jgi:hypothetical protein